MWPVNFQMFKLDLEKAEEPEIKLPILFGSLKKQESSRKMSTSALLTAKAFECGSQETVENSKRWEYQRNLTSWEIFHPAYLTYMQNTSCKMLGWIKHKLEPRLPGEIPITSDMQMTPLLWQKSKKNYRASSWKWKKRVEVMEFQLSYFKS